MMYIDRDLLLYKVKQANTTYDALISQLGINRTTFYRHLRDNSLTVEEMYKIIRFLNLSDADVVSIFLCRKVA